MTRDTEGETFSSMGYPLIVVFDLDDTLVQYGRRIVVPKQTWHVLALLQNLGAHMYCVSYNPLANLVVGEMGLRKLLEDVVSGRPPRYELVGRLVARNPIISGKEFIYVDDRGDNIEEVQRAYPMAKSVLVRRALCCCDLSEVLNLAGQSAMWLG